MAEENPILEEVRRTREQLLAKHNGDLDSLVSELQRLSADRIRGGAAARPGPVESVLPKKAG
jgi:hypothetical protein